MARLGREVVAVSRRRKCSCGISVAAWALVGKLCIPCAKKEIERVEKLERAYMLGCLKEGANRLEAMLNGESQ